MASRFENAVSADTPPQSVVRFQCSATEQEIWQGALSVSDTGHVLAFFRELTNINDYDTVFKARQIGDFVDLDVAGNTDDKLRCEQKRLKHHLQKRLQSEYLFDYSARLVQTEDSALESTVTTGHLKQLCKDVESSLTKIIQAQINEYWRGTIPSSPERAVRQLQIEQAEHQRFAQERGSPDCFVGRKNEIETILNYIRSDSPWPLVIQGDSGSGKTALLSRAFQDVPPGFSPLLRCLGTTPASSGVSHSNAGADVTK